MTTTALVVAGTATRRDAIRAQLSPGFHVVAAEGGLDALKRLRDEPADCLVAAVDLPDVSVGAFVERVLDEYPGLPILLVGRPTDQASVWQALRAGAVDHVAADEELARRVERAVFDRAAESALEDHERLLRAVYTVVDDLWPSTSHADVKQVIYGRLSGTDLYDEVWVGEYDPEADEMTVRYPVAGTLDASTLHRADDEPLVRRAVGEGAVVVTEVSPGHSVTDRASGAGSGDAQRSTPVKRTAVVPFDDAGTRQGFALVSTRRNHAFDATERDLLGHVGEIAGYASRLGSREDERLSAFAENIIHELRNPVGIALAHLEMGREANDPEALDRVRSALERVHHLVENLASMAGFEGRETATSCDLEAVATKAWDAIDAPNADLVVEGGAAVVGDPDLLELLFSNLLRNAVEHGGDGVTVRVGAADGGFFVEDDGAGITPPERDRVFQRGYPDDGQGLGIGLSIVQEVVDVHGWEIDVEGATSGGARFVVTGVETGESDERPTDV